MFYVLFQIKFIYKYSLQGEHRTTATMWQRCLTSTMGRIALIKFRRLWEFVNVSTFNLHAFLINLKLDYYSQC